MHLGKFAKIPKPIQMELMMRSGVVDHVSKRRPIFSAMSKEKPKEDDNVPLVELPKEHEVPLILIVEDQAPFVEGLDSRTSLSQPGENDAKSKDQAQAQLLRNQAC